MRVRHAVSDLDWPRIQGLLPARAGEPGRVSAGNRLFFDAVLWVARTGVPWRDLPERFGRWNSVWRRFDRWAKQGIWRAVLEVWQDLDLEWLIRDSNPSLCGGSLKKRTAPVVQPTRRWAAVEADSEPKLTPS